MPEIGQTVSHFKIVEKPGAGGMKSRYILSRSSAWLGAVILAIASLFFLTGATKKMKPAELVEKHLASIGTPEARAAAYNRVAQGTGAVLFNWAKGVPTAGDAVVVSEGKSLRLSLRCQTPRYQGEDIAYDGKKVSVGLQIGVAGLASIRSELLKEGLIGGTLTTAWALLDVAGRRSRLEYNGLKKRDGKEFLEMRYFPRRGAWEGEFGVLMYFDPQTFRHMQSEYKYVGPRRGKGYTRRDTLTEEFGDFAAVDGLTLPRLYTLRYGSGEYGFEWSVTFANIQHNQRLDANAFVLK